MGRTLNQRIADALAEQWGRPDVRTVALHLPYPTSVNRLWRRTSTGVHRTPAYGTWFRAAGNELNMQRPGRVSGPYALTISLGRPDRKRRDLDNTVKAISDLLVHHKVVDDDSEAVKVTLEWGNVSGAYVRIERASVSRSAAREAEAA